MGRACWWRIVLSFRIDADLFLRWRNPAWLGRISVKSGNAMVKSTQGDPEPSAGKRGICWRSSTGSEARGPWAPWKNSGAKFHGSARQGTAQVILGIPMTAGKARTAESEDGVDLALGRSPAQEFLSDPLVGDAPVWIGEALRNAEAAQPSLIGGSRCGGGEAGVEWS